MTAKSHNVTYLNEIWDVASTELATNRVAVQSMVGVCPDPVLQPNDSILFRSHGKFTVVASCYYIDDPERELEILLLLMARSSPFFYVVHHRTEQNKALILGTAHNIVHAVELYVKCGGDV